MPFRSPRLPRPVIWIAFAALAGCSTTRPVPAPVVPPPTAITPQPITPVPALLFDVVDFASLEGWAGTDPRPAVQAFQRSCLVILDRAADASLGGLVYAGQIMDWRDACQAAATADLGSAGSARSFFEDFFAPVRLSMRQNEGFFTGYYEPELRGSRTRHDAYQTPIYGVPADLVKIDGGIYRDTAAGESFTARMMMSLTLMRYVPYPTRAEIERNGIPAPVLFYVDDPIDAFFLQVQGSGRVALDDGTVVRAAYAGQNGQPYTAIGAILLDRGELTREELSLQSIKAWLVAHPEQAREIMDTNDSYVFFSEQPIGDASLGAAGAEGVALTPAASIAIDASIHPYGVPVWLEGTAPDPDPSKPDDIFDHLLIAQDTGGAIRGPLRGDIYWGIGPDAAAIAGRMKNSARMTVLLPKPVIARMRPHTEVGVP